jgi:hypothetical protein
MIEGNCLLMLEWTATGILAFLLGLAGGRLLRSDGAAADRPQRYPPAPALREWDTPAHGYEATREAATEAFARSW